MYKCVTAYCNKPPLSLVLTPWIVIDSYLNLRDTVYNRRRTLLVPLLFVISPRETGFTTIRHDYIIRVRFMLEGLMED